MKIIFDGLYDIKEFILMVDIYQWCDKEKEWGGLGYIIQNCYYDDDREKKIYITESDQSKVIRNGRGCIIVTPYSKQISWLFNLLYLYVQDDGLDSGVLLDGFGACCEDYFKKTPDHSAKELMLNILENIQLKNDIRHGIAVGK